MTNTVVAGSTANCAGTVVSDGFNVSDDLTRAFGQASDRNGIDPGLAPFDNTALSPSARPLEGSPLVDTGGDCETVDQLDALRPTDGDGDGTASCDVGAVEVPGVPGPSDPTDDPTDPDAPRPAAPATPVAGRPTFTG